MASSDSFGGGRCKRTRARLGTRDRGPSSSHVWRWRARRPPGVVNVCCDRCRWRRRVDGGVRTGRGGCGGGENRDERERRRVAIAGRGLTYAFRGNTWGGGEGGGWADAFGRVTCKEARAYGALPERRGGWASATIHYGRATIRSDMGGRKHQPESREAEARSQQRRRSESEASQERCASMHRSGKKAAPVGSQYVIAHGARGRRERLAILGADRGKQGVAGRVGMSGWG